LFADRNLLLCLFIPAAIVTVIYFAGNYRMRRDLRNQRKKFINTMSGKDPRDSRDPSPKDIQGK
jgi:hypothetical protein